MNTASNKAMRKMILVESILDNPVYLPSSALLQKLRSALIKKLSTTELASLEVIINCKNRKA